MIISERMLVGVNEKSDRVVHIVQRIIKVEFDKLLIKKETASMECELEVGSSYKTRNQAEF